MIATRSVLLVSLVAVVLNARSGAAWEQETHVGLTQRAAMGSHLDEWLRDHDVAAGLQEQLRAEDRKLIRQLDALDPALDVVPDHGRQTALAWLLAGSALEGAREDRLLNHFFDPRRATGLAERDGVVSAYRSGDGIFARPIAGKDGMRADRWADAPTRENPFSRARLIDELFASATAPTEAERSAALARALLCAGAIAHVLEAVGDPANARGDFVVNYKVARAPLERWAATRYGLSVPPATPAGPVPTRLGAFFTNTAGTGLADEIARDFVSPGTMPGSVRALPSPALTPGREPEGMLPGARVRRLVSYERTGRGVRYRQTPEAIAETVDTLLPHIARAATNLLDFLFRGSITFSAGNEGRVIQVGRVGLGPGRLELFEEKADGRRARLFTRDVAGAAAGATLIVLDQSQPVHKLVAVYRGSDENGEPLVLFTTLVTTQ